MDTQVDWQRELDESFGSGQDVPTGHYIAAGRSAVRRRRVTALVVAAVVLVGGGAAWAAVPGGSPSSDAPVATQGPAPTQRATEKDRTDRDKRLRSLQELSAARRGIDFLGNPAALTEDGLVMAAGAGEPLEQRDNPMGYPPQQGTSLAIRVMFEGSEHYSLMVLFPDGGTSTMTNTATGDFSGWLAANVRTQQTLDEANGVTPSGGEAGDMPWLVLGADGRPEAARGGIEISEGRTPAGLGASFGGGATSTGVVRLVVDGRTEYAAYRVVDGTLDVVPGPGVFTSLDAFVEWARQQYASGTGMR